MLRSVKDKFPVQEVAKALATTVVNDDAGPGKRKMPTSPAEDSILSIQTDKHGGFALNCVPTVSVDATK